MPITPRIAGDVNGDGYSNDRAFVFDPAHTADSALAAQMQQLLGHGLADRARLPAPAARQARQLAQLPRAVDVEREQRDQHLGESAQDAAAAAREASLPALEPARRRRPAGARREQRARLGTEVNPDQTLLYVRGFDPDDEALQVRGQSALRLDASAAERDRSSPVTITALVSLDLGPSRERQSLTQMLDRGRKYKDQQKQNEQSIKSNYSGGGIPNPMTKMLRQFEQLKLTPEQADSIATLNRWFTVRLDSIWSPVAKDLAELPEHYDQGVAYDRYRAGREASFDLLIHIAPDFVKMLTREQKRLIPQFVANYLDVKYLEAEQVELSGRGFYDVSSLIGPRASS